MTLQFTLFCTTGQYKPISTLIQVDSVSEYNNNYKEYREKAIRKIAQQRYWTNADLTRYHYTKLKVRVYDKEKIARENAERYKKIKEENGWT